MQATYDEVLALGGGDIKKGIASYVGATEQKLREQLIGACALLGSVSRMPVDPLVKGAIDDFLSVPIP